MMHYNYTLQQFSVKFVLEFLPFLDVDADQNIGERGTVLLV
jgi:hypothetical protein